MNYDRWKNHPIAPWVERRALTNDPEELAWVIYNFDPERRRSDHLASLIYGWKVALKWKITPASNRRLARFICKNFTRPASFCS
jgi:hypothetical protein